MTLQTVLEFLSGRAAWLYKSRADDSTRVGSNRWLSAWDLGYCALLAIAAFSVFLAAEAEARSFLYNLVTFDGRFYLDIARHGYAFSGDLRDKQNVSFLPLEAIAIWLVEHVIPGTNDFLKIAVLGLATLFGILVGFFALLQENFGKDAARLAGLVWAFSPMALFHFVGYTEPLFALATVWCLVALDRGWMWTASCVAGVAMIGRPQAFVLVLFVGIDLLRRVNWRPWRLLEPAVMLKVFLLLSPLMIYATWMAWRFGDSALYANSMEAWRRGSLVENFLPFFRATHYFFQSVSSGSGELTLWTTMLCAFTLAMATLTLAMAPMVNWRIAMAYLGFFVFLALVSSFEIKNVARHVFYFAPWAIITGAVLARVPGPRWRRYVALVPWLLLALMINVIAISRFYHGDWVS